MMAHPVPRSFRPKGSIRRSHFTRRIRAQRSHFRSQCSHFVAIRRVARVNAEPAAGSAGHWLGQPTVAGHAVTGATVSTGAGAVSSRVRCQ
jgi:hypothetical protein